VIRDLLHWLCDLPGRIELAVFECLWPPKEDAVSRAIREEGERLRKAFPDIDFDHPGARKAPPPEL